MFQQQDYRGSWRRRGGNTEDEKELASKTINVENKRFFVDVKQNQRGKFIKLAEVGPSRRSRILLSFAAAAELRDRLVEFQKTYAALPPHGEGAKENVAAATAAGDKETSGRASHNSTAGGGNNRYTEGRIASETIIQENRRYYLDFKENARGRFLRITMSTQMQRAQIVLPAQGMEGLKATLDELLTQFATPEDLRDHATELESQKVRIDGRMFYFDVGNDRRGMFLRISEVRSMYRTAITIPETHWEKFRDVIDDYSKKKATLPAPASHGSNDNEQESTTKRPESESKKRVEVSAEDAK